MERGVIAARTALSLTFLAGSGCATIDTHSLTAGWPDLMLIEHHVPHAEMRDRCGIFVPFGSSPEGCAIFKFQDRECHVYVSADFPSARVLEHERLHCKGYDHVGSTDMQKMLADWNSRE